MSDLKNLIGQTFGELTVIKRVENNDVCGDGWAIDVIAHIFNNINIDK